WEHPRINDHQLILHHITDDTCTHTASKSAQGLSTEWETSCCHLHALIKASKTSPKPIFRLGNQIWMFHF
uniref:Uncharacterized protein n=1 Tax=Ciona intestinalis TaxID=7719 RepID=H2Y0X9_CIOIN